MGSGSPPVSPVVSAFHTALVEQLLVVVALVVGVWAAWNALRNARYRRSLTDGVLPAHRPRVAVVPEPPARKLLRLGFGWLWIFDGLLQLQSGMPLGMPDGVIRPAASSSPVWLRALVDYGATLWSRHPVMVAASVVWIQLGVGILLLVAPRGWWSRWAGLAAVGWALVVWVFGEALGGILAPGASWLFGAPGAAVFYAVAGVLLALPDGAWSGGRVGRLVLRVGGVFFLVMAVLQAWPGRGFWQGAEGKASAGSLLLMVKQMAQTSQPAFLVDVLHAFGHLDASHGWAVNLVVVGALAVIGLALCTASVPLMRPALWAAVALCTATWVLVQDLGFLGGVGTDPNSMVPLVLVLASGFLAVVRPAEAVRRETEQPVRTAGCSGSAVVDARPVVTGGPWWHRASLGYLTRVAGASAALGVVVVGVLPMSWAALR